MKTEDAVLKRTRRANKTYSFADGKNPRVISEYWFQNTIEGLTLFLVFYTSACRYSRCTGCNLPSKMSSTHIEFDDIMRQIYSVFYNILSDQQKKELRKIIVSNNGSVLDEDTFSTTALVYLIAKINLECPAVTTVTLETRPEYVEIEELIVLARALTEGEIPSSLELAIGFEAFDEHIRNDIFNKGLSFEKIEQLARIISRVNKSFINKFKENYRKIKLKTYFMLKPISGMTEQQAIDDIKNGIDYLDDLASHYEIEINMHLNPTFVAKGTILEKEFMQGIYSPPDLESVRESVLFAENKRITVFIGLNDEGLAVEGGSFIKSFDEKEDRLIRSMEAFNATQDYSLLK